MVNETITNIANIALALSVVIALIFGIAQVRVAARDRRERFALEALRNFQTREFAEMIHYIVSHQMPKTRGELESEPHRDQVIFIQFAQQMESLGLLVAAGLVDLGLVDRTLGSLVAMAWEKYKTMFLDMRKNDPYIAEYFQWLAEQIEREMRENPRKPYHQNIAGK